jgi:putative addiction module component (TIGR02574 family)
MSPRDLHAAALALPREERAELAKELLESLDESPDDVDAAWAHEISRRAQELADGTVEPVDWEVARERIARRLRERRGGTETPSRG